MLPAHIGTPGRTRTCYPRLRRPMLYPNELRAHNTSLSHVSTNNSVLSANKFTPILTARRGHLFFYRSSTDRTNHQCQAFLDELFPLYECFHRGDRDTFVRPAGSYIHTIVLLNVWCPGRDSNPQCSKPANFKSAAYSNSATRAIVYTLSVN